MMLLGHFTNLKKFHSFEHLFIPHGLTFKKNQLLLLNKDAFDSLYREAYKHLLKNDDVRNRNLIKASDKPPKNLAVWCRRLYSPLLL